MTDILLNALEQTNTVPSTQLQTITLLVVQVITRLLILLLMCALVASTVRWEAGIMDFLVTFKGVFSTHLFALLCCLVLRVYRVMLASYPSEVRHTDAAAGLQACAITRGSTLRSFRPCNPSGSSQSTWCSSW